ncbi:hypothetical protein FACS1894170_06190 [Planctomycetales bacterium]|nr:hypothetical protein FACS1894170_06190 [Planctomycetales bacterium]
MSSVKLHHLQRDRASNIRTMTAWSWSKTDRHTDLIEQQIVWAVRQRNLAALDYLEEFRRQVIEARCDSIKNYRR